MNQEKIRVATFDSRLEQNQEKKMEASINFVVFEGKGFPVEDRLLHNVTFENSKLLGEMMSSGHYIDGIDVSRFLRDDLTINLEKLELAVTLVVTALEANAGDEDVTLQLRNLDEYYALRGIKGLPMNEREERTFLLAFISSVASEASTRDTLIVKYV